MDLTLSKFYFVSKPELFTQHLVSSDCPEKPQRVVDVHEAICNLHIQSMQLLEPVLATWAELQAFHELAFVRSAFAQTRQLAAGKLLKLVRQDEYNDTDLCQKSVEVSALAAGSVLAAYRSVCDEGDAVAFANVRPPCHHSRPSGGGGFCIFNGIAVTASIALQRFSRIAIIDIDAHHGNGTQLLAENERRVFYVSAHRQGIYPHTGQVSDAPNILNCPIVRNRNMRTSVLAFFAVTVAESFKRCEFEPDLIFVVAGFDGHKSERHGNLGLESADYEVIAGNIRELAPQSPVVAALAGGYGASLGDCAASFVKGLLPTKCQGQTKRRKKKSSKACGKK